MSFRTLTLMPAVTAGIAASAALSSCASPAGQPTANEVSAPATTSSPEVSTSPGGPDYSDGQYSAEGHYGGLPSSIGVTVTLSADIVTEVSVTPRATDPTSLDLQKRFADAVPGIVVGRDIDEIKVDRLAGSSGTPQGFNAALERIKAQANN
ncbi:MULTISPECIES: hypothetical protein [unclassified Arthrobacter]|uniref:hypothetical protein n=1 Tax=unclassified Arthrobacter TaxID=235627 RepID=UPI002882E45C|nr:MULTISPECIES: hypothetical protein [unclassified Arthrobacter]